MTWWLAALVVLVLLVAAGFAYGTAHRLDRLHIRTDLAAASLREAFSRRHTVAIALAEAISATRPETAATVIEAVRRARERATGELEAGAPHHGVEVAENRLTRALGQVPREAVGAALRAEVIDVCDRLEMARRFYNDAVRDTRRLRELSTVRALRLAGKAPLPEYIELIDPSYN